MRDKLIELLQGMHNASCDAAVGWLDSASFAGQLNVEADYLIEHGVGLIPYAPVFKAHKFVIEPYCDDQLRLRIDFSVDEKMHHAGITMQNEELEKLGYIKASKGEHTRRIIDADKFCMYLADVQLANRGVHDHICDFIDDVLWAIDEERFVVQPKEIKHD